MIIGNDNHRANVITQCMALAKYNHVAIYNGHNSGSKGLKRAAFPTLPIIL